MILQVVVWNLLAHKAGYQAQAGAAWTFANNPFVWLAQLWAEATSMAWGALPLLLGALTIYLGGRLVVVDEDDDPLARFVPTGRRPFRSKDPMHRIEPRL